MQNSTNKGVSKSNKDDDDEEYQNEDYSDEDKQSKFSDNKERNKFKKQMTGTSGKPAVNIPSMVNSSSDVSDTEGDSFYITEKEFTLKEFYDYDNFPESTGSAVLPWTDFTRDFMSLDIAMTPAVKQYCENTPDSWIDMRPYMIENPEKCTRYDFLPKVLARFRHMHLRHLCVTDPTDGTLEGVITRQDIFLWMPL